MAILKHIPEHNPLFDAVLSYLTQAHDEQTGKVILDENGYPMEREGYLIAGLNCEPETFDALCLQDRLRFRIKGSPSEVTTHQYVLSFHPDDRQRGLTVEAVQQLGLEFARTYFPGHRAITCTHPDGRSGSGNIHVHIVISNIRCLDQAPRPEFMPLRPDGTVKPSSCRAGCRHQDTARLRQHMSAALQEYCRENGYTVSNAKAARKVSSREYSVQRYGQRKLDRDNEKRQASGIQPVQTRFITKREELCRAVDYASQSAGSWDEFTARLASGCTRQVEQRPAGESAISYPRKKELWSAYHRSKDAFWQAYKIQSDTNEEQLVHAFQKLKEHRAKHPRTRKKQDKLNQDIDAELRSNIAGYKEKQKKLRLIKSVYQCYARAAALALAHHMEQEALTCLEEMETLARKAQGYWQDGWQEDSHQMSMLDHTVHSWVSLYQTGQDDLDEAQALLRRIEEVVQKQKDRQPVLVEEPFPVGVKVSRGNISYKHPDMQRWVRGKRLGSDYELPSILRRIEENSNRIHQPQKSIYRSGPITER